MEGVRKMEILRTTIIGLSFFALAALQAGDGKDCKTSADGLENSLLKLSFKWKNEAGGTGIGKQGSLRLNYKPDDAELVSYIFGAYGHRFDDGLLWAKWKGIPFAGTPCGDNAIVVKKEKDSVSVANTISLSPEGSRLRFDIAIANNSAKTVSDNYTCILPITAGRLEKAYNDNAFFHTPKKGGGFDSRQVVPLWGEYKSTPHSPVIALSDREDKLMFIQTADKGAVERFTFSVGVVNDHAGKEFGKITKIGMTLEPFTLNPGESVAYRYEWALVKGLSGLSGYSDGLAIDARMDTSVRKPGSDAKALIEFASAIPLKREVKVELSVKDADGRQTESISKSFALDITPLNPCAYEMSWKAGPSSKSEVMAVFSVDGKEVGRKEMSITSAGPDRDDLKSSLLKARGKCDAIAKSLPRLSAEYPETFKHLVLADYYGVKAEDALKRDDIKLAASLLDKMDGCANVAEKNAMAELKNPAVPALRSLKDRQTNSTCYVKGQDIYSPEGSRLYLQGLMDAFGCLHLECDENGNPIGKSGAEFIKSPQLRKLAIDRLVREAKSYGNFVSLYIKWELPWWYKAPEKEFFNEYLPFIDEVMATLRREHIWVTPHIEEGVFSDWFDPERRNCYLAAWRRACEKYGKYENITHYVATCPEPRLPMWGLGRDKSSGLKLIAGKWTEYALKQHGSFDALDKLWSGYGEGVTEAERKESLLTLPPYVNDEGKFSIRVKSYEEFVSSTKSEQMEELIRIIRESGDAHPIFLGVSAWTSWPLNPTSWLGKYAADPRIAGLCVDKYNGGHWSGISNPPEMIGDAFQVYGSKPLMIGEWSGGSAYDFDTTWRRGFQSARQCWGTMFAGLKAKSMVAWAGGNQSCCRMFDPKTKKPLPVTQEMIGIKNELIANPLPQRLQVLSVGNRNTPTSMCMAMYRLAAYFPQVKVDFSQGDIADLERWELTPFKLIVCNTEGVEAKDIAALRNFKGKVLLLGRPNLPGSRPGANDWMREGIFLKGDIECQGKGGVSTATVKMLKDAGALKAGSSFKHVFAKTKCAWVAKGSLLDNVEILAEANGSPALMRQDNIYWWTDMLGVESADLPISVAPTYPKLRESEENILKAVFDEAGVQYEVSPLQVWISNDIAYSYETTTGRVEIHNQGTVQIPEGMILCSYERFKDGIAMVVAGNAQAGNGSTLEIRCPSDNVSKVIVNGAASNFERDGANGITLPLAHNENGKYDIEVRFGKWTWSSLFPF